MIEYTAAYWATTNPVLPLGVFGLDTTNNILKLGNGETRWLDLVEQSSGDDRVTPLINQTFSGEFNLSTNYEVYYNAYTTNTTVTPTVSSTPLVGAVARVVFDAGASSALTATNLGTLRAGSDIFTVSKLNEILVFSLPEGLEYSIKVLN